MFRPVPQEESGTPRTDVFGQFPEYSVRRFRVLLSSDESRAVVEQELPAVSEDPALLEAAEQLRKPVVIATKHLGDITLDPRYGWFQGKALWNGSKIDVNVHKDKEGSIEVALAMADVLWSAQRKWKKDVGNFAVAKLVRYAEDSREDDEANRLPNWLAATLRFLHGLATCGCRSP